MHRVGERSCVINSDNNNTSSGENDFGQHPPSFSRDSQVIPSSPSPPPLSGQEVQDSLTILHFNDVYNIEGRDKEPVGGAARFKRCLDKFSHLHPLTLFSGDALSPSNSEASNYSGFVMYYMFNMYSKSVYLCSLPVVSVVMKGEQMVPVLNSLDIQCAVYGNHDFGRGDSPSVIIMYTIGHGMCNTL